MRLRFFSEKEPEATIEHRLGWEDTRRTGMFYYVFTRGILAACVIAILAFFIFDVWIEHQPLSTFGQFVSRNWFGWLAAGGFTGFEEWKRNEKRYRRELAEGSSENYESPEQTLRELQRGMANVAKH